MTALIIFAMAAPWVGLLVAVRLEERSTQRSFKRFIETGEL